MKKILVPIDFSNASHYGLAYAEWLSLKFDAKVIALNICPEEEYEETLPGKAVEVFKQKQTADKLKAIKRFTAHYPNESNRNLVRVERECFVQPGATITGGILKFAEENEIDIIVIGTRTKHNLWHQLFGSVSTELVKNASIPVCVVPEGTPFDGIKNIALATDFDLQDDRALTNIRRIAEELGAKVHQVFVNTKRTMPKEEIWETNSAEVNMVNQRVVITGLQNYLEKHSIDLLAVSIPDRPFLQNLFRRSLSKQLVLTAKIPLLVFHNQ